jgi:hypothetical protein
LIWKKEYRNRSEIRYCRETVLAEKIKRILPAKYKSKLKQYVEDMNDEYIDGTRLSVLAVHYVRKVASEIDVAPTLKLSKVLSVTNAKLESLYRSHASRMSLYYVEALLRGKSADCDVLVNDFFDLGDLVGIGGEVVKYNRYIDISNIKSRKGFVRDEGDSPFSYLSVLASFSIYAYYIFALLSSLKKFFIRSKDLKKDVAVQVLRNNLDFKSKNDLYWLDSSDFLNRVLLIENREVKHCSDLSDTAYIRVGYRKGAISSSNAINDSRVASSFLKSFMLSLKIYACLIQSPQLRVLFPGLIQCLLYKSVFEAYSTKVFITNLAYTDSGQILAAVMSKVVYVRGCWSNQGYSHPEIATAADVLFAWGDITVDTFVKSGSVGVTYVKTGFIDGKLLKCEMKKIQDRKRGEEVRICFFDNMTGYDICNSIGDLKSIFRMLLDVVLENQNVVLVYKPKSGDYEQVKACDLYDEFAVLEDKKRIVTLVGQKGYDHVPSSLVGHVDLVVGFPISSAATEVSFAGIPSIHINLTQINEHPWETGSRIGRNVCHNIEDAKASIISFLENDKHLDDRSLLQSVNYFEDLEASGRMQYYIESLCIQGVSGVAARVNSANDRYAALYGKSSIEQ